jgi:molecular chaperone GrpE
MAKAVGIDLGTNSVVAATREGGQAEVIPNAEGPVQEGLRSVLDQMDAILTRQGVRRIGRPGEPFDPTHHDTVAVRRARRPPDRTVVDVVRSGFVLGDRVLGPAQVVVSRRPECEA